jgi:hypothetical protein
MNKVSISPQQSLTSTPFILGSYLQKPDGIVNALAKEVGPAPLVVL